MFIVHVLGTGFTDFEGPVDEDTIQFSVVYENKYYVGDVLVDGFLPKTVNLKTTMAQTTKLTSQSTETLTYQIDPATVRDILSPKI